MSYLSSTLYKVAGTDTFRLSSTKLLGKYGGNLQNIEKSQRERYISKPGYVLVQVDQAGAEALIVAHLMPRANKLRQLFDNHIKIHNYLGTVFVEQWEKDWPMVKEFASVPLDKLKDIPEWGKFMAAVADSDNNPPATRYYYHYKQTGHSANYNIKENTFIENILLKSKGQVRLTRTQGTRYLEGYHNLIPEIRGYYHRIVASTYEKTGVLHNLLGYPLAITKKHFEHDYTKIYDKIPQSTVGCITHIAYTNMFAFIQEHKLPWDLLANTHDSYLGQCPESDSIDMAKKMKELMEQELLSPFNEKFNMKSEVQCGYNWRPFDEKKNPRGLKTIKI